MCSGDGGDLVDVVSVRWNFKWWRWWWSWCLRYCCCYNGGVYGGGVTGADVFVDECC